MSKFASDLVRDLFIFEMANNHQGEVQHGLRIIHEFAKVARRCDVRAAIKLQYRDLDTFIHPEYVGREDVSHIPRFLSTRLSDDEFRTLVQAIRDEGMLVVVTPFDERSVNRCLEDGVDIIKVASCSAEDWPLLTCVVEMQRPVIVSTGGLNIHGIDRVVSFLTHGGCHFALMHCVGLYPAPNESLHMGFLTKMRKRYPGVPVGYSGHEDPNNAEPGMIAVAMGAQFLERHVGLEANGIRLNAYSSNPAQAEAWIQATLRARTIAGNGADKRIRQEELDSLQSLKRGVFAASAIPKGKQIPRDAVFFAMPCVAGQLTSGEFGRYRTKYVASRDYGPYEAIEETALVDDIAQLRNIVHDARGFLYEAGIEPGPAVDIEISHHYGITQFRRTGAVIVNLVNRTYCKKLIIVFPGQCHPHHAHTIKEETFQ